MTEVDLHGRLVARSLPAPAVDVARLRRERHARLQAQMIRAEVEVALLLHGPHVAYATGLPVRAVDVTEASFDRPVAAVVAGGERPHLLWDGGHDLDVVAHPAVWPELDEGAARLAGVLRELAGPLDGCRIAVDEQTGAMLRAGVLAGAHVVDAAEIVGAAKVTKTADELACIALAQIRNERAMVAAQAAARPGVTRSHVAGEFLAALHEMGAVDGPVPAGAAGARSGAAEPVANLIDPIFQVMPRSRADGPRTTTGDVAFPTGVGDPTLATGDLVWVDSGIDHLGYASDFGRTWIVGREPDAAERRLFSRWCEVMMAALDALAPGVSAGDLCRAAEAANGGAAPWLPHFYLAHGLGIESAEMPLVGTDLGRAFDDGMIMAPGMVLVLEPVVWEDGAGGYRAEEILAVTHDGWCHLGGGHPYPPFTP